MQANLLGRLGARKRNSREDVDEDETPARKVNDLQSSTQKKNMHQENAVLAGRTEAWERLDKTMSEASTVSADSDEADLSAMLGSLGLGGGKFVDGKYGNLKLFDKGLEGYVGLPDVNVFKAMMQEHASTEKFTPSNKQGTRPLLLTP
jgi:hypothetical protein